TITAESERIKALRNTIMGGAGNGITLGGSLAAPSEEEDEERLIDIDSTSISGYVNKAGSPATGVTLAFTETTDKKTLFAVSGSGGYFSTKAEPGQYASSIASPGHKIENISADDTGEFGRLHNVIVLEETSPPQEQLASLYDIEIEGNEISNMGLSGIGYPRIVVPGPNVSPNETAMTMNNSAAATLLALLGNPIVTLGIHRNHIHDCLRNPFDGQLRADAQLRGFGGITLGDCENVTISENRIERNGTSHVNPVCGISAIAAKVDIHHNHILDNGPLAANLNQNLERGVRGGIVLVAVSFGTGDLSPGLDVGLDTGRHAARIHENIVQQPAGQALRMIAMGPVSICDNRFATDISGPEPFEVLAGTLFVLTIGGLGSLPGGITLFNSNQLRLGPQATSFTSQIIWTLDDLGFDGNQSVALPTGIPLFVNTLLIGQTLRATDSRFKESPRTANQGKISLLSANSLLNNTNDNHGDHCIFAFPIPGGRTPIMTGNQVVDATFCDTVGSTIAGPMSGFQGGGAKLQG
ncbi:MAG: right-handed parallel beta-helix repeat-containing protein, partial [Gammaproteobacteria bacterium]|nr:right-handed parallel beta-helix repeat-containing protein [Gammaproteobacteria bacterium]